MCLQQLASRDCGFESCRGHGCLYHVSVVRCQVEFSAMGRSLVQRRRIECGVFVCVISNPQKLGNLGPISSVPIKRMTFVFVFEVQLSFLCVV